MGGSYSDLYVYLRRNNNDPYKGTDYTVTFTKKNFPGCCSFVEFTHKINISNGNLLNYNVLLYDGYSNNFKGNYVFGYYYPSNDKEVIEEVRSYYSVLAPSVPLVVSFKTKTNTYNCYFGKLKDAGWDRAYNISGYSFGNPLSKYVLDEEFKKLLLNRTIKFTTGKDNKDIACAKQEIKGKNFRFIFLPKRNESVLGIDYLFSMDFVKNEPKLCESQENKKCQIDPYFLDSVNGQYYDGIIVYFAGDDSRKYKDKNNKGTVLLLEFIDYRKNNICLRRKDKDGCWWCQEKVNSNDDKKLLDKLKEIKKESDQAQVVTVILDNKASYKGVTGLPSENGTAYTKYTHTYETPNKPVLLFEMQEKKIVNLDNGFKTKNVDVYYLKAGGKDDSQPFLIVIDENGNSQKKKICHFKDSYEFEEWMEFKCEEEGKKVEDGKLFKKLEEKVQKIKQNGSCIDDLTLLRWYAFQILTGKDPPTPEVKKETEPTRPQEVVPPTTTEPLSIPLIAGCTVGGVVFVVSSATGYGIYWYNTTIKLLT